VRLFEHPDFDQVILQAAEHFQLRPAIIEKDYYVTEVLRIIAAIAGDKVIFKGALIREGTILDAELTTRPIAGVGWTVDTALVYNKQRHPKTIPVLARYIKRRLAASATKNQLHEGTAPPSVATNRISKRPPRSAGKHPGQMTLLG